MQVRNRPRKRHVDAHPTDEVKLSKQVYGEEKRQKLQSVNEWDCRPVSRRIINPNKQGC